MHVCKRQRSWGASMWHLLRGLRGRDHRRALRHRQMLWSLLQAVPHRPREALRGRAAICAPPRSVPRVPGALAHGPVGAAPHGCRGERRPRSDHHGRAGPVEGAVPVLPHAPGPLRVYAGQRRGGPGRDFAGGGGPLRAVQRQALAHGKAGGALPPRRSGGGAPGRAGGGRGRGRRRREAPGATRGPGGPLPSSLPPDGRRGTRHSAAAGLLQALPLDSHALLQGQDVLQVQGQGPPRRPDVRGEAGPGVVH
mmetsp:Transcript_34569/g.103298  ORF Transcript_34569/g.103298 Transcript_34569/m.103298 type:complete len:252 (-) Transcript_34569:174-929(-)